MVLRNSGGSGAERRSFLFVEEEEKLSSGCSSSSAAACSSSLGASALPSTRGTGPYRSSPRMGCPAWDAWTRIW